VKRTVEDLVAADDSIRAGDVRRRARQLLGRDSESLSDRMFVRILKDAHDEGIIDLRRRGNDFEVARATDVASVADQLAKNERAAVAAAAPAIPATPSPRLGMGPRGAGGGRGGPVRSRPAAPPPGLFAVGVVDDTAPVAVATATPEAAAPAAPKANGTAPAAKRGRGSRPKSEAAAPHAAAVERATETAAKAKRGRSPAPAAAKKSPRARAKKSAAKDE
jgi:hypothetical protein